MQASEQKIYVTVGQSGDIETICCHLLLAQVYCVSASYVAGFVLTAEMGEEPKKLVSSSSSKSGKENKMSD